MVKEKLDQIHPDINTTWIVGDMKELSLHF